LFLQGRVVSPTPNPHPGGPGLYIYIPHRQGDPVIPLRHPVPILVASYDTHGLQWDYSYSPVPLRSKIVLSNLWNCSVGFINLKVPQSVPLFQLTTAMFSMLQRPTTRHYQGNFQATVSAQDIRTGQRRLV
jgi:hypothetical protein